MYICIYVCRPLWHCTLPGSLDLTRPSRDLVTLCRSSGSTPRGRKSVTVCSRVAVHRRLNGGVLCFLACLLARLLFCMLAACLLAEHDVDHSTSCQAAWQRAFSVDPRRASRRNNIILLPCLLPCLPCLLACSLVCWARCTSYPSAKHLSLLYAPICIRMSPLNIRLAIFDTCFERNKLDMQHISRCPNSNCVLYRQM